MDERFADLNRQIPGFGGYFRGENGNFVVYLTHPTAQRRVALEVLMPVLASQPIPGRLNLAGPPQILVRQGRYTFAQLDQLRNRARDAVLGVEGLASVGVHAAENRILIGVRDTAARNRVQAVLARVNLRMEAFMVRVVGQGRLDQGTPVRATETQPDRTLPETAPAPSDSLRFWIEAPREVRRGEPVPLTLKVQNLLSRPVTLVLRGNRIPFFNLVGTRRGCPELRF